jgi:hypothetical protein
MRAIVAALHAALVAWRKRVGAAMPVRNDTAKPRRAG